MAGTEGATSEFAEAIIEETTRVSKIVRNLLQLQERTREMEWRRPLLKTVIEYVVSLVKTIMRHDQIEIATGGTGTADTIGYLQEKRNRTSDNESVDECLRRSEHRYKGYD